MNFKPNPLLYGANEDFFSTFRIAVKLCDPIDFNALSRAVARAVKRYPYFRVHPVRQGNSIVLEENTLPVPVFPDGRCVTLGGEESKGHLISIGCEGKNVYFDASHFIADGMGISPLLMTVLYCYVADVYGEEGIAKERIRMPESDVSEGEYVYPFPETPFEADGSCLPLPAPKAAYGLDPAAFDGEGLYTYHLHIPQKDMMAKAQTTDGSPVSFLSVMLYRAFCRLDDAIELPVVAHVQHQYRAALRTPFCHHSLVNYVPAVFYPRMKDRSVEQQNTVVRGQVLLGSEKDSDLLSVNRLMAAMAEENAPFEAKKAASAGYTEESTKNKTFGISYVGKMDWCGLDRYVEDIYAYIGEKHTDNMLLVEVMTIGEDFTLNFMQSGRGERYLNAFLEELNALGIPYRVVGEERFTLCNTVLPE